MNKSSGKQYNYECHLDRKGVDTVLDLLVNWMEAVKVQKRNLLRCRLAMDTILLHLCEHYNDQLNAVVKMGKRFGRDCFSLQYAGEAYNPMESADHDGWTGYLLSNIGLTPVWNYRHGINELSLKLPYHKIKSEMLLLGAVAAAIILGFLAPVIPEAVKEVVVKYGFTTISKVFMNFLGTFAGLLVFLSVISGICGIGNISDFSRMGKYLVSRNVILTFAGGGICAALMIPFFSFQWGTVSGGNQVSAILDMLIGIIPSNPVTPFADGNMLQIVFMAVLIGVFIVVLGGEAKTVKELAFQANAIVIRLVEFICRLLSVYILSSLTMLFWENGMGIFITIWKPLVFCIVLCFGLMFVKMFVTARRCKVSVSLLMKKVMPAFMIGLTTSSSAVALGTMMDINSGKLGVPEELNRFGSPIEMLLCCETTSAGFIAVFYYLAEYYKTGVNAGWFITVWIITTLISFAMPPVAGGTMVCLGVMLTQFGLPQAAIGIAGTLSILLDFIMTACRIVISQMELVLEAKHWENLDQEKLEAA